MCQRESWFSVYTVVWQGSDGNESGAYFCMHESEKAGRNPAKKGRKEIPDEIWVMTYGVKYIQLATNREK